MYGFTRTNQTRFSRCISLILWNERAKTICVYCKNQAQTFYEVRNARVSYQYSVNKSCRNSEFLLPIIHVYGVLLLFIMSSMHVDRDDFATVLREYGAHAYRAFLLIPMTGSTIIDQFPWKCFPSCTFGSGRGKSNRSVEICPLRARTCVMERGGDGRQLPSAQLTIGHDDFGRLSGHEIRLPVWIDENQ